MQQELYGKSLNTAPVAALFVANNNNNDNNDDSSKYWWSLS